MANKKAGKRMTTAMITGMAVIMAASPAMAAQSGTDAAAGADTDTDSKSVQVEEDSGSTILYSAPATAQEAEENLSAAEENAAAAQEACETAAAEEKETAEAQADYDFFAEQLTTEADETAQARGKRRRG
ncbi:MAG: hypothetical protein LUC83_10355 [Clostridiales bacterium]|nr:hypothetical protein [Clostridiales bacterium]